MLEIGEHNFSESCLAFFLPYLANISAKLHVLVAITAMLWCRMIANVTVWYSGLWYGMICLFYGQTITIFAICFAIFGHFQLLVVQFLICYGYVSHFMV